MDTVKPDRQWLEDWQVGEDPSREIEIAENLLKIFDEFWDSQSLDSKSKTTKSRYADALHALGGYLAEKSVLDKDNLSKTADDLLAAYLGPDEGPLIHYDNEQWQNEIDMVCRKLFRFINR
jgi:hypothetical protein